MNIHENRLIEDVVFAKTFTLLLNTLLVVDLFRMLVGSEVIVSIVQYAIYIGCAIYVYWQVAKCKKFKIDKNLFYSICFLIITMSISYLVCPDIKRSYSYYILFVITRSIPALYFTLYLDKNKLKLTFEYMRECRFIWLLYIVVGMFWIPKHTNSWNQYSITYGYNLLIPTCIIIYYLFKEKKIKWIIYTVIFSISMLWRGSRGAILCLLVFIVLIYIMNYKTEKRLKRYLKLMVAIVFGIVAACNFKNIALILGKFLQNSRTLNLLSSNINFDSGRSHIQSLYWNEIMEHPFKFNGIFSDRIYYSKISQEIYDMTNYPHNIIVELFFQWGILLGTIIFFIMVCGVIRSVICINKIKNNELTCIVLIFLVSGFIKLFFSASYLVSIEFYLLVGIIICSQRVNRFKIG